MICQLTIKNFAIIDDLTIDFPTGFLVFTGETGAGKSIIIDALGLLIGERASASMVRYGTSKAFIEGVFTPRNRFALLNEYIAEDEQLIVSKEIDVQGRSTTRINGRICNVATIRLLMANIVDIHNQNENQYLLDPRSHLALLDNFSQLAKANEYQTYQKKYNQYRDLIAKKNELMNFRYDPEKVELLEYQKKEIEELDLKENEIDELEIERVRIMQFEKTAEKLQYIKQYFEDEQGILVALHGVKKIFDSLRQDPLFELHAAKMNDFYYEMDAFYDEFKITANGLNYDPDRIAEIQNRIFAISKITRKHGQNYEQIQGNYLLICEELMQLKEYETEKINIDAQIKRGRDELIKLGNTVHQLRVSSAPILEAKIKEQLKDLYLENAQFSINFNQLQEPAAYGLYEGEFYISLNPGTPLKPLVKVISGGEMSRLMLGLKVIFNTIYGISATIFDEIDTGVSGKIARSVGMKMQVLSKEMQVICITHLPQVAALADVHYYVDKKISANFTTTEVRVLNEDQRIFSIAQMLSSEQKPSQAALENAKELIKEI